MESNLHFQQKQQLRKRPPSNLGRCPTTHNVPTTAFRTSIEYQAQIQGSVKQKKQLISKQRKAPRGIVFRLGTFQNLRRLRSLFLRHHSNGDQIHPRGGEIDVRGIWSDLGSKQRVNICTFREALRYSRSEGRALNVSSISGSIYLVKVMGLATWNGTDVAQTQFIP